MNDLETIENYVTGKLPEDERTRFETALRTDPALADALAFYVLAKHTAKVDARAQRQAELDALRRTPARLQWVAPMGWAAAASVVLLLGLGWYFVRDSAGSADATQFADAYVTRHFDKLPATMNGGSTDSLMQGIGLYNDKKFAEAEVIFQDVLTQQPDNDRALKFAGVVALRLEKYDIAIDRFHRLSQRTDLFSNPGTFLEAIALLQRNRPMDKEQAKKLLEDVINRNLEGKTEADALLTKL
jgi:tetratricopeptide (TPR) repeat protein